MAGCQSGGPSSERGTAPVAEAVPANGGQETDGGTNDNNQGEVGETEGASTEDESGETYVIHPKVAAEIDDIVSLSVLGDITDAHGHQQLMVAFEESKRFLRDDDPRLESTLIFKTLPIIQHAYGFESLTRISALAKYFGVNENPEILEALAGGIGLFIRDFRRHEALVERMPLIYQEVYQEDELTHELLEIVLEFARELGIEGNFQIQEALIEENPLGTLLERDEMVVINMIEAAYGVESLKLAFKFAEALELEENFEVKQALARGIMRAIQNCYTSDTLTIVGELAKALGVKEDRQVAALFVERQGKVTLAEIVNGGPSYGLRPL